MLLSCAPLPPLAAGLLAVARPDLTGDRSVRHSVQALRPVGWLFVVRRGEPPWCGAQLVRKAREESGLGKCSGDPGPGQTRGPNARRVP